MNALGKHTVSVVIPTYNRPLLLKRAIDSVLNQSFADYELIIVQNGAIEHSRSLVNEYIKKGCSVQYIHEAKAGGANARNVGIHHSKGIYVAFLDDDDEWLNNKLETQVSVLNEREDIDLVYAPPLLINQDGSESQETLSCPTEPDLNSFLTGGNLLRSLSGILVRRSAFKKIGIFNTNYTIMNDYEFYLRVLSAGKIFTIQRPLYRYYFHANNLSQHTQAGIAEFSLMLDQLMTFSDFREHRNVLQSLKNRVCRDLCDAAVEAIDRKDYRLGFKYYWMALTRRPDIGLEIAWGRSQNKIYRLMRPYASACSCFIKSMIRKQIANV